MHGQGAEGVDLLGHLHRSDFSRHRSADSPGHHQRRQDRTQLAANRYRNDRTYGRAHPQLVELKIRLGREDRAGECARDHDDELRKQPDLDDLFHEQAPADLLRKRRADRLTRQDDDVANVDDEGNDRASQRG